MILSFCNGKLLLSDYKLKNMKYYDILIMYAMNVNITFM